MNKKMITCVALCGMVAGVASADITATLSGAWSDTATWGGAAVPDATETKVKAANGVEVTVNSAATAQFLVLGDAGDTGGFVVNSGSLDFVGTAWSSLGYNKGGYLTVNGGSVSFVNRLDLGTVGKDANLLTQRVCTLTMTGGAMDINNILRVGNGFNDATSIASVNLSGGTLEVNALDFGGTGANTVNFSGDALMTIKGDKMGAVDGWITSGNITGVTFVDNVSLVGGDTIIAIPEPATFGLIAVFGGGMLFLRRRLKI